MKRLVLVVVVVLLLAACGGKSNSASRDKCEAQYGVGNCVKRDGRYVPLGVPLGSDTTTAANVVDRCKATADAARAASAAYYANHTPNQWPTTFSDLTNGNPPVLELPAGSDQGDTFVAADGWRITMAADGTSSPTFTCST